MNINHTIAKQLDLYGVLLQMDGDDGWRANTVFRTASLLRELQVPIDSINPQSLKGVGSSTSSKINEILHTGTFAALERLKLQYPASILDLTKVHGIGAKKALKLWQDYGVRNLAELQLALKEKRIDNPELEKRVEFALRPISRLPRGWIEAIINPLLVEMRNRFGLVCEVAGSIRRKTEDCKDADLLIREHEGLTAEDIPNIVQDILQQQGANFEMGPSNLGGVRKARTFIQLSDEIQFQIDILSIPKDSWGSALNYFTGSRDHNITLRQMAIKQGLKVNEFGIYDQEGNRLGGRHESDLYRLLGVDYVPPELREGHELVYPPEEWIQRDHIRMDLHIHTDWSDGHNTIEEMLMAGYQAGMRGIGICDHSYNISTKVDAYLQAIHEAGAKLYAIRAIAGVEVDIRVDGGLAMDDEDLAKFELVIAAVHKAHDKNVEERLVAAAEHPKVHILAHPTGRQYGNREIPDISWSRVFKACKDNNVALEINCQPDRVDLPESLVRIAHSVGCLFVLNSDAHSKEEVAQFDYGVAVARKAELTRQEVYRDLRNFRSLKKPS